MTIRVSFSHLYTPPDIQIPHIPDARALFERVVNNFPADRARPIWERWARYEYQFGSLEAAQILDKRMSEVYPNGMARPIIFCCPNVTPCIQIHQSNALQSVTNTLVQTPLLCAIWDSSWVVRVGRMA